MISIEATGIAQVAKGLQDLGKRVDKASALAITRTAVLVRQAIYREMESVFDRPTPYTMRSLYSTRATSSMLQAEVSFREFAGKGTVARKYLGPEVYGGGRNAKRFEVALRNTPKHAMPGGMFALPSIHARADAYGNIPGSRITTVLSRLRAMRDAAQNKSGSRRSTRKQIRESYFIGSPGGGRLPLGVYQRATFAFGSSVRPVFVFGKQPTYKKRLPFFEVANQVADQQLDAQYLKALGDMGAWGK